METEALREIYYSTLMKEEGITKDDLSLVDLDIAFTPVIPIKGGKPMEAIKLMGGNYAVPDFPLVGTSISPESLTVMRYRYLMSRRNKNPFI